jgi:hypothetical protein
LGVAPFILGDHAEFETRRLTLEFKNNIDGLISDIEDTESGKSYGHIDVCVCWSQISDRFQGYDISEITEHNIEQREFPGTTHLLHRDGESHVIQVIMLKTVVEMINAGNIKIGGTPALEEGERSKPARGKRK